MTPETIRAASVETLQRRRAALLGLDGGTPATDTGSINELSQVEAELARRVPLAPTVVDISHITEYGLTQRLSTPLAPTVVDISHITEYGLTQRLSTPLAPTVVDISHITEYGLTQRLSTPIRCF